jgi:hypothetical protein
MQVRIYSGTILSRLVGLLVLLITASCVLLAQSQAGSTQDSHPSPHQVARPAGRAPSLLSSDEGLSILAAALESRRHADSRLDCSHLIHSIYERAGFPYTYASSADLYRGAEDFQRVNYPQTGDLIVWPGHAGIVISGEQHTFFSALRSGRGVESYAAAYWKRKGRPRFFRYIRDASNPAASSTSASVKLTGLRSTGTPQSIAAVATDVAVADEPKTPATLQPLPVSIPRMQPIHSNRPKPEDVTGILLSTYEQAAQALESRDLLRLSHSVIVCDNLSVRKVQLKRDQGWAEVQVDQPVPLVAADSSVKKHSERHRWSMVRKDPDTWDIALPPDTVYVSRDTAVRLLAHQLSALTDLDPQGNHDRKVRLASLLNSILSKNPVR